MLADLALMPVKAVAGVKQLGQNTRHLGASDDGFAGAGPAA
jgi:hypothetical protein